MNWLRRLFCSHKNLRYHRKAFYVESSPSLNKVWYWCPDCHRLIAFHEPRKEKAEKV